MLTFNNITGIFITFWGFLTVTSWYLGFSQFVSIPFEAPAMQFNTALCFIFLGLAQLFRTRLLLIPLLLITIPTILQELLRVNLGIDTLLYINPHPTIETVYVGRMSIFTSLFFTLLGLGGLVHYKFPRMTTYIYAFVTSTSLLFLLNYIPLPISTHGFYEAGEGLSSISVLTCVLFILHSTSQLKEQLGVYYDRR